jgi:hypothetical protein
MELAWNYDRVLYQGRDLLGCPNRMEMVSISRFPRSRKDCWQITRREVQGMCIEFITTF